jgi:LCP family protein required for cell wall assembly
MTDLRSRDDLPSSGEPATTGSSSDPSRPRRHRRHRRARRLRGALGVTLLGTLLPGAGLVWTRRRWAWLLVLAFVGGAAWLVVSLHDLHSLLDLAFDADRLRVAAVVAGAVLVVWTGSVLLTHLLARPRAMSGPRQVLGLVVTLALCAVVAAPVALSSRYASTQADLVEHVFEHNGSATAPTDVTVTDPWGGRDRVNVLLLGGDGQIGRDGVRTDSVILVSMSTRTGDTVMFSLPRNMMDAPFPADSPLHAIYPDGFTGEGDPAAYMLNAVYGQVPALHPGVLGRSSNEGADAVKQAVEGTLGIPVDYYLLVNLDGFKEIVDAMGGVTVNINEPIAIQGNTDAGIPPVGYLQPGPDQRLNGYQALWFSRGRWGSDDYERMLRQRCMVNAIIDEANPLNLLRRYEALAAAGRDLVRTDVPSTLLPAFVDLALQVKQADVRSVAFVRSDHFSPEDPDFAWVQARVQKALQPVAGAGAEHGDGGRDVDGGSGGSGAGGTGGAGGAGGAGDGSAVPVQDSCGYHPVG